MDNCAMHMAQSRYCEQCRTDVYGCVRMCTEEGHMVQCVPCAVKFQKHMALRQPCANCPLCPLCPSCPFSLPALHSSVRSGGGPPPCALHNVLRQPMIPLHPAGLDTFFLKKRKKIKKCQKFSKKHLPFSVFLAMITNSQRKLSEKN